MESKLFFEDLSKIIHNLVPVNYKSIEFSLIMNFTVPEGTRVPSKLNEGSKKERMMARKPTLSSGFRLRCTFLGWH